MAPTAQRALSKIGTSREVNRERRRNTTTRTSMTLSSSRKLWNNSFLFQWLVLAVAMIPNYLLLESQALMATSRIIQRQERRTVRPLWSSSSSQPRPDVVVGQHQRTGPWMLHWWNGTQLAASDDDDRIRNYAKGGKTILIEAPSAASSTDAGVAYRLFPPSYHRRRNTSAVVDNTNISWAVLLSSTSLTLQQGRRFLQSLGPWYLDQLQANPLATKSLTTGLISTVGDTIAQWWCTTVMAAAAASGGTYSVRRGLAVFVDGLLSGPLMHMGYATMERLVPTTTNNSTAPTSSLASNTAAMVHVLLDTVLLDSFFVGTTMFLTGLLEGVPLGRLASQVRADYGATIRASWMTSILLCPLQFACFRYLPLRLRVLAVNCIDVVWDAVLSFYTHRSRRMGLA